MGEGDWVWYRPNYGEKAFLMISGKERGGGWSQQFSSVRRLDHLPPSCYWSLWSSRQPRFSTEGIREIASPYSIVFGVSLRYGKFEETPIPTTKKQKNTKHKASAGLHGVDLDLDLDLLQKAPFLRLWMLSTKAHNIAIITTTAYLLSYDNYYYFFCWALGQLLLLLRCVFIILG